MNNVGAWISRAATTVGSWVHAPQQVKQKIWGSGSTFTPLSSYASVESHHHLQNKEKYTNNSFYYFLDLSLWFCFFLNFSSLLWLLQTETVGERCGRSCDWEVDVLSLWAELELGLSRVKVALI
jgi:hypothetical protein